MLQRDRLLRFEELAQVASGSQGSHYVAHHGSLLLALSHNERNGSRGVRLFECANVFHPDPGGRSGGEREVVVAYGLLTGREVWNHAWTARFYEAMGGEGPRATPTWDEGRLYALGATGEFRCLEAGTGKAIWSCNILTDNGAENLSWGMAASPLIIDDKVIVKAKVNGGRNVDFVLDTGSEQTTLSRQTASSANVRPITYTLSAGVGEVGLRGLQLGKMDTFELGTLKLRNVPTLIKAPALRGIPKKETESFSPLALGLSMTIDYATHKLSLARRTPTLSTANNTAAMPTTSARSRNSST